MLTLMRKLFGTKNDRDLKLLYPILLKVNSYEAQMKTLSDEELKAQTLKFRKQLSEGSTLEMILPEAFATVREASVRVLKMRHFDVQILGGIVLFQGKISEMKTGEGKTLTATLPLYLHGLTQKGAHLVTANDYLAKRDAAWMGAIYTFLGLTVGCVTGDIDEATRKAAYLADITYGTNNEFAFDYLRDNMKFNLADYVQHGHNYCIVDEVDSILIDEARTPLLISGPSEGNSDLYNVCNQLIPQLKRDVDFTVDEKSKSAMLTEDGMSKIQQMLKLDNLYNMQHAPLLHHLNQALRAHFLFNKDTDYVVKDGSVIIVDEFTGRLKEGSRWSDGLHQSIEAKEGLTIKKENQTLASITFQNYFRSYSVLAGMTGTADTEAEEFKTIYGLDVVVIPTNVPMIRNDQPDIIFKTADAKFKAVTSLIKELYTKGQPVLVGTISIDNSERIAKYLKKENIPHEVLNAKQHEREAQIIARAGEKGAVTIATNMAGRGTDIKLTDETKKLGGLFILGTERHESRRIDNQLRGRSGRQGDEGASKFFLSLEDDLMRIFGSNKISSIMDTLGMKEDEPIEHKMISNAIARAQKKVEGHNFEIRKHLLEYDSVMHAQRQVIYKIRKEIIADHDNIGLVKGMIDDVVDQILMINKPNGKPLAENYPWDSINEQFQRLFHIGKTLTSLECDADYEGDVTKYLSQVAHRHIDSKLANYPQEQVTQALRELLLMIFDSHWKNHLLSMDHLKDGIGLRSYAQKNPLNEYKREGYQLFETMRMMIKQSVVTNLFAMELYTKEEIEAERAARRAAAESERIDTKDHILQAPTEPIARSRNKLGRNDDCPCGSGKKFKHCHGA